MQNNFSASSMTSSRKAVKRKFELEPEVNGFEL